MLHRRDVRRITAVAMAVVISLAAASLTEARIYAIDGDTVDIDGERIRIANIDTPEIDGAQCAAERQLGLLAKERMRELVREKPLRIFRGDHGRKVDRHGRTLARIEVKGRDVGETLIREGLARKWTGKRSPWCGGR
ncbi:thermonuclease family protein [Rhizobium sp. FKY42]|uniref:thermonuclease family protein n=1 Tax=Rhizobium sp. FKY42 TaxID=2562310 RepID=UPI0010C1189C|nr:thermonuclease family protein [Rhizobium sp. FKY42]